MISKTGAVSLADVRDDLGWPSTSINMNEAALRFRANRSGSNAGTPVNLGATRGSVIAMSDQIASYFKEYKQTPYLVFKDAYPSYPNEARHKVEYVTSNGVKELLVINDYANMSLSQTNTTSAVLVGYVADDTDVTIHWKREFRDGAKPGYDANIECISYSQGPLTGTSWQEYFKDATGTNGISQDTFSFKARYRYVCLIVRSITRGYNGGRQNTRVWFRDLEMRIS